MRARPTLFFVVEGGGGFVCYLVEGGMGLEPGQDADDGHQVDGHQGCKGDFRVYLHPLLVDDHAEKEADVLGNYLDLAGPGRTFAADVRLDQPEGPERQERLTDKRSNHFEAEHRDDRVPLHVPHDAEDDHRNGYRDFVSHGVEPLSSGGAAGVVQIFPELSGGGCGRIAFFVFLVVGGGNFAVDTIQDERQDDNAKPLVGVSVEVHRVADPGDWGAPDAQPVGAEVFGFPDTNQESMGDGEDRECDEHSTDQVDHDLELTRQRFVEV